MYFLLFGTLLSQATLSFSASIGTSNQTPSTNPYPVVLWHGMGDTCCTSLAPIMKLIEIQVPSIYVLSLQIGKDPAKDFWNTYFMDSNHQIDLACSMILSDPKLSKGFNLIGFSQGGQFTRALVQRCPVPVRNLITFGGQHQGVFGLPRCVTSTNSGLYSSVCNYVRKLLSLGAYNSFVQNKLVQAQYWHDPLKEIAYREKSLFLADINNERTLNETYRSNLLNLTNFVMVKFDADSMVIPRESSHFGFYQPGSTDKLIPLEESQLYLEDRLGLKALNETGRMTMMTLPGDHLSIGEEWFSKNIIDVYLK